MRDPLLPPIHLVVTVGKLLRPGGARTVAAGSLLLEQQIIISNRFQNSAPNLTSVDRLLLGRHPIHPATLDSEAVSNPRVLDVA